MNQPKTDASGRIMKDAPAQNAPANGAPRESSIEKILVSSKFQKELVRAVTRTGLTAERMARVALTALRRTPNLSLCSVPSFLGCLLSAAQLGLEPNTPLGFAYLIPRRDKRTGTWECTMMIGYPGMLALSERTGRVREVDAQVVRGIDPDGVVGDVFDYEWGTSKRLRFRHSESADRERRSISHVWAQAHLNHGGAPFTVLSLSQIEARRERSAAARSGPWVTDYEAMAQKTAIRALWRFLPKSAEMAEAERLESVVERGQSQTSGFSDDVKEALANQGLDVDDDEPLDLGSDTPPSDAQERDEPPAA